MLLNNKVVLITGAAGSIGSELARQCLKFKPKLLVLFDQAESPLHELDLEFKEILHSNLHEVVIGDVRNKERLTNVFNTFKSLHFYTVIILIMYARGICPASSEIHVRTCFPT